MIEDASQAAPCALSPGRVAEPPATGGIALAATTFADVAGIDEVRADLEEMVQFLRSPQKFARLGAHIPRGALLVGAPGTGKTLLARAVAGEADVPFFHISASELVEVFVGVGASRVRNLFQKARHLAPAVIFIDELDAVGRKRSNQAAGHEERDQTLNQLLVEMDGFRSSQAVVVLAATNRVDILDQALLRPGRFDRHINVPLPDRAGREAILALHTARVPLHEEIALSRLARLTVGMSGADLASLVNEAALCAARQNLEQVDHACFEQALARMQLGAQRPLVLSEAERRVIACHEGGHALVAHYLPEGGIVNGVTILPRGQSLGVTHLVAAQDCYNYSRQALMARIAVGLSGRAAEELTAGCEHVTIGAESDLRSTTALARRMVTRWGMGQEIAATVAGSDTGEGSLFMRRAEPSGYRAQAQTLAMAMDARGQLVPVGHPERGRPATFTTPRATPWITSSLGMATLVEREVRKILDEGYGMARQILQEHAEQLQVLADTLVEREQLNHAEFETLMSREQNGELF
jgi:cell division protease FtsH